MKDAPDYAKKLVSLLIKNKLTLSLAESCTGGALSDSITNIPGSSQTLLLGIIAYANNAKSKILKIPKNIIQKKGAVSAKIAKLMSQNVLKLSNSDLGVGITGIAGPSNAVLGKPIGTVFIAIASKNKVKIGKFKFSGERKKIKNKSVQKAIQMLLKFIKISRN